MLPPATSRFHDLYIVFYPLHQQLEGLVVLLPCAVGVVVVSQDPLQAGEFGFI